MEILKYIITEDQWPIIFSPCFTHAAMAENKDTIIGAGFIRFSAEGNKVIVDTFGSSVSLGINSRPEDADIIQKALK